MNSLEKLIEEKEKKLNEDALKLDKLKSLLKSYQMYSVEFMGYKSPSKIHEMHIVIKLNKIIEFSLIEKTIESLNTQVKVNIYDLYPIDWSEIPHYLNWVAVDKNGKVFAYSSKPEKTENMWQNHPVCQKELFTIDNDIPFDWEKSLIYRYRKFPE